MAEFGKLNFSVSFNPTSGFPIDARYYFDSLEAAQAAAGTAVEVGSSDSAYFIGMNLVVVADGLATMYVIQPNKTLKPVGTTPVGDGKTIAVSPEGTISLVGIADAQTGAYPSKKADGSIEWIKPDTTTVEGLTQEVEALGGRMDTAESDISALKTTVGGAESGLVKQVNDLSTNLSTNYYDKSAIDGLVAGAFHFKGAADSFDGTNIIIDGEPLTSMKAGDVYQVNEKEYAYNGTKWVELGFTIDLSNYALKTYVDTAVSGAKTELQGYADQAEADALTAAKSYADTQDATNLAAAKSYADEKVSALNISQYATTEYVDQAETDAIAAAGTAADSKIAAKVGAIGETTVKGYVDTALQGKANTVHQHTLNDITDKGALAALDKVSESELAEGLATKINGKADKATTLAGYSITDAMTATAIADAISTAKGEAVTEAGNAADTKITNKVGEIGSNTVKQYVDAQVAAGAYDDGPLAGRVTTVEGQITAINNAETGILAQAKAYTDTEAKKKANVEHTHEASDITDLGALATKNRVAESDLDTTLAGKINGKADSATVTALQGEVDTLEGTVAKKADAANVYTKTEVYAKGETDTKIAEAVAAASHLKRAIVEALPEIEEADANTIYMVAKTGEAGEQDAYDEYFVIEGAWEKIGDTVVDLTDYATTESVTSAISSAKTALEGQIATKVDKVAGSRLMTEAEGTKLAGINNGAQVNVIESITVNGEAVAPTGKTVNLPLATAAKVGMAKPDGTSIEVNASGAFSVKAVDLMKINQAEGDVLILNCGTSVKS